MTRYPSASSGVPLERLQRWMLAAITDPDGAEAGIASDAARAEIDVDLARLEEIVRSSRNVTAVDRLRVYANAYFTRLLECLRDEFPALRHALGPDLFDGFGVSYLQEHPSRSYTLSELGRRFPRFLRETRPVPTIENPDRTLPGWEDFLIELATVERCCSDVFFGPGTEGRRHLQPDDVARIPLERVGTTRLVPAPCLRILKLRFPVHNYISAVRRGARPAPPGPQPTHLLVTRRDFVVRQRSVAAGEYALLEDLSLGCTIGDAVARAALRLDAQESNFESTLFDWFRRWAVEGLFLSVDSESARAQEHRG